MARWTYAFSNGSYNDWHRQFEGIAGIDIDFIEVCPNCYEPLAIKETCFDKGQSFKATTLTKIVSERLRVPGFLIFYTPIEKGMKFRIKRITEPYSEIYNVTQEEWLMYLRELQKDHKNYCKYAAKV
tara:strand:- start:704 stop:1084 length:381 start_codon:yes stop_codon:yes gene_type:complete